LPTQVKVASLPETSLQAASISPIVSSSGGDVALKTPLISASAQWTTNSARSRTSMISVGTSGPSGASTSPPRLTRTGQ